MDPQHPEPAVAASSADAQVSSAVAELDAARETTAAEREHRAGVAEAGAAEGRAPADPSQADITPVDLPLDGSLEAICMVVDDPVDPLVLAQVLGRPVVEVVEALHRLAAGYAEQGRGFELRQVPGGWRFYSRPEYAGAVERFILDGQQARLTQASLETLAVVAYRQPISRSRVSAVRGVNVDGVMRTLLARGLVEEAGTEEGSGATLYRTSSYFLERLGLDDLTQLPDLAPLLPDVEFLESTDD